MRIIPKTAAVNPKWQECWFRKWLNNEFLQKFTDKEQERIAETTIAMPNSEDSEANIIGHITDKISF